MDSQLSALLGEPQAALTPAALYPAAGPMTAGGTPHAFADTLKDALGDLDAPQMLVSALDTLLPTAVPVVAAADGMLELTLPLRAGAEDGNSSPQSGNDLPLLLQLMNTSPVLPQTFTGARENNPAPDIGVPDPDLALASAVAQTGLPAIGRTDLLAAGTNNPSFAPGFVVNSLNSGQEPPALTLTPAVAVRGEGALNAQTASHDQQAAQPHTARELELLTSVASALTPVAKSTAENFELALPAGLTTPPPDTVPANPGVPSFNVAVSISPNLVGSSVTASGKPELAISQVPGQPGWSDVFADRVTFMVKQNLQEAEIRLNPPQLGQMEVRIVMSNDQANLMFSSPHGGVREAIEASIGRLRDMLADNGFNVVNVDVSDKSLAQQRGDARARDESGPGTLAAEYRADFELAPDAPQLLRAPGSIDYYV